MPLFQRPQNGITRRTKRKSQRKPNIASVPGRTDQFPNGSDEPCLGHPHDGAEDAETKGADGGDAGWEQARVAVDGDVIATDAALEEEMFGEGDTFVDGKPVALGRG